MDDAQGVDVSSAHVLKIDLMLIYDGWNMLGMDSNNAAVCIEFAITQSNESVDDMKPICSGPQAIIYLIA